jgi:hypothetical protein
MSFSIVALRSLRQSQITSNCLKSCLRKGSGHHGPNMPPFAQLKPPSNQVALFSISHNFAIQLTEDQNFFYTHLSLVLLAQSDSNENQSPRNF